MRRELRDERAAAAAARRAATPRRRPASAEPPELLDELEAAALARDLAELIRAGAIDLDLGPDDDTSRARPSRG